MSDELPEIPLSFSLLRGRDRGASRAFPPRGSGEEELQRGVLRMISHLDAALSDEFSVLI